MVPDCNFMGTTSYKYLRGNIYKEEGIKLARSCTLDRDTVIGQVFCPHLAQHSSNNNGSTRRMY
jgi:hypothetical protein